uniref:NDUFA4 mitochondrial complex associated like 2 n=1 Tax=Catharus ustulatus TaxID=91951 RepID=A0A8C3UC24_CATUS
MEPRCDGSHRGHGEGGEGSCSQDGCGGAGVTEGHPGPLVPLIGFISVGLGSAVLYLLRLALYSPDVSWDRKNNPEPWNKLSPTDQYKVSTGGTGRAGSVSQE